MYKFRKDLYLSPSVKNLSKIKWKIRSRRGQFNIYLIILNHDSKRIEYFHNSILKQRILAKQNYDIIGLASSAEECIDIVDIIHTKCYEANNNYDTYAYLSNE